MKYNVRNLIFLLTFIFFLTPAAALADQSGESFLTVTVVKKDNLVNICKKYLEKPHEWQTIAAFNQLKTPHLIYPDQQLKIPLSLLKGLPMPGTVTFLKGQVEALPPESKKWIPMKMGGIVTQGAQIKTGQKSAVEVTFEDGASFFLRPETELGILTARKKGRFHSIRQLFVPVGKTLMKIQKSTGQKPRFEIQTPSAVSAARGTSFRVSVDENKNTRTEVLTGVVGVTGKGAKVVVKQGRGTLVRKGHAPKDPADLLPPPDFEDLKPLYQTLPASIRLKHVGAAAASRMMVARDPDIKDVVLDILVEAKHPVLPESLMDGTYFCQTLSIDSSGLEGVPSISKKIEIRVNPRPPFIQKPLAGQEFKKDTMILEWLKVPDADAYRIQVASDPEFKSLLVDVDKIKRVSRKINLPHYGPYYARVRSIARDGFKGVWSDTIVSFHIEPPKAPSVEAPEIDEKVINLRWKTRGDNMAYHFQMAKDPLFQEILMDKTVDTPGITFDKPKDAGSYHVRISTLDADGYEGTFSTAQSFEVAPNVWWQTGVGLTWILGALIIIF